MVPVQLAPMGCLRRIERRYSAPRLFEGRTVQGLD